MIHPIKFPNSSQQEQLWKIPFFRPTLPSVSIKDFSLVLFFFNFYFFSPSLPLLLFSFSSPLSPVSWRWAQLFVSCLLRIVLHCPGKAFVLFQRACAATQSLVVSASHRSTGMKTTTSSPSWEKTSLRTQIWNLIIIPVRSLENVYSWHVHRSSKEKICLIFADLQKYPETDILGLVFQSLLVLH